jgi:hypothetical protein
MTPPVGLVLAAVSGAIVVGLVWLAISLFGP